MNSRGPLPDQPPSPRLEDVRRIAVFRALVLGDMICAGPALRALRARFPQAHISLVGLPWAREWVRRTASIDAFIEFPGYPDLPERAVDVTALPAFMADMQAQRFDLAVQLHGSGQTVNALLATWGARQVAAFCEPGQYCPNPELSCPWPKHGTEVQRLLALTDVLGAPRLGEGLEWTVRDGDRAEAAALLKAHGADADHPYVCVHPGAQLASRQWMPESFAQVADQLALKGFTVVLTGVPHEQALGQRVQSAMTQPSVNLVGQTSLWNMGALIERARLLVCNDTGVSHVASALKTPSVVISCGGDVDRWAPVDQQRHQVLWVPRDCRPCGHRVCPYAHECATGVTTAEVMAAVDRALG
ncbi:MAG: glycosyltransferase family 9 protein [Rubrivivax sp.]|nr:MAG: glycosyltransferase family 9 protein [Rubrivivax sp.]